MRQRHWYCHCGAAFPGELAMGRYLLLNVGELLIQLDILGIVFFCACCFSRTKYYFGPGGGIPVAFFLVQMLGNLGGNMSWMKDLSLYSLFPKSALASGSAEALLPCLLMAAIAVLLWGAGTIRFTSLYKAKRKAPPATL